MHEEVDLCWSRPSFLLLSSLAELLHWDVYTRAPFLYAGSKAACHNVEDVERGAQPTGGPSQALVCALVQTYSLRRLMMLLPTLYGATKREQTTAVAGEKTFILPTFNLSQKVRLSFFIDFVSFAWQLWKSMIFFLRSKVFSDTMSCSVSWKSTFGDVSATGQKPISTFVHQ